MQNFLIFCKGREMKKGFHTCLLSGTKGERVKLQTRHQKTQAAFLVETFNTSILKDPI